MDLVHSDDGNGSSVRGVSTCRTRSGRMSSSGPERQMSGPLYANRNHEFVLQVDHYTPRSQHPAQRGIVCDDPYCTTCPMYYHVYAKIRVWSNRLWSFLQLSFIPGVMNPRAHAVQQWNKFFVISCSFAVFLDPFFFFLLCVQENNKCIVLNWSVATILIVLRSMNDFIYLLHILLQFRLSYVAPGSRVVGPADLIVDPKMIARNYLSTLFIVDFFVVLPLSQISILFILVDPIGPGANFANILLVRLSILVQLVPRLYRIIPLFVGSSPNGFFFESAWSNVVMNLATFVFAGHVVGACWYLFGLERVYQCFEDACRDSNITRCMEFIDCRHGNDYMRRFGNNGDVSAWMNNENAIACFGKDGFEFGIYQPAVNLTTQKSIVTRYVYSLFWGFQQISTLAGNQVPSYFVWEVVFTLAITGVGLLLFALLIGNVQNFLQAFGRRRLEWYVRCRDVELWMTHHCLPEELRSEVRNSERLNWTATPTTVVNEKDLLENLSEDLQQRIRRHLFKFVERVRIFHLMGEPIVDAIRERLKARTYIRGSKIVYRGNIIDKMLFIIRGKMESSGADGISSPLSEGDVCGEELLTWCLEHFSVNKDGEEIIQGHRLLSNRDVICLTNVEAFVLRAADLQEVTSLFSRFLRSPRIQGAIRYESSFWRLLAARQIQVAWRCRKKPINQADSSSPPHN